MKLQKILKGRSPEASPNLTPCSTPRSPSSTTTTEEVVVSSSSAAASPLSLNNSGTSIVGCPTSCDVLFGRGKPFQSHPGNIRLHKIVDLYKARYSQARRHKKTEMAEEIVQIIKCGGGGSAGSAGSGSTMAGRFLKRLDDDVWVEVSDIVAREKVSHALRGNGGGTNNNKSTTIKAQQQQQQDNNKKS